MIHYHGLPITPAVAAVEAIKGGHAFVSFRRFDQLSLVLELAQSFAVDNGAFSAWRAGEEVKDWGDYYAWIESIRYFPGFDFAVIPDAIDQEEKANDQLLSEWPHGAFAGAPVWHLHESLKRLERLVSDWPRICLGSSGAYSSPGSRPWWDRMRKAMSVVCKPDGTPRVKLHGLRMLDSKIVTAFPFASADSTNIARNIGIDCRWTGSYPPMTKEARASVLRHRIESHASPMRFDPGAEQGEFMLRGDAP